jgi:methyltransferase-like protein
MEEVNDPVYFHEFAERAAAKRLSYLGEANLDDVYPSDFLREAESVLHVPSFDMVRLGQYTDFLHNRAFRQTLLCHEHRKPSHTLRPERLVNLYIATQFRPTSPEPRLATTDVEEFKLSSGRWFQTASPVLKTALAYLGETWPRPVRFGELLHTVCARLNLPVEPGKTHHDREALTLGQCIVDSFSSGGGYFELWTCPPGFTLRIGERPVASPLARLQARTGDRLTNLRHEVVPVAPIGRRLVTHLDGSHDHQALCDVVTRMVMQGELKLEIDGQPVREPDQVRVYAETAVKRLLAEIASHALLVG